MSLGEIFTAPVENIVSLGSGLVHHNGLPIFVPGTAPGDMITGRICQEKKGWAKAELLNIEEASSCRTEALCPLYGSCGGCNLQHINYQSQLEIKADILKQAFTRIGKFLELPKISINPSEPFEYRNRMQFHRVEKIKQGRPSVGLKMRESDTIIPTEDCPIADPGIRKALQSRSLKPHISKDRFTVYSRDDVFLSESGGAGSNAEQAVLDIMGKKIHMDVNVFFQSNGNVLEKLLQDIIHAIKDLPQKRLLGDFYCGVGTFSIFLQDYFDEIDLLEENKQAIVLAQRNLAGKKAEYYALSDDKWVSLMNKKSRQYDAVIVDPPRVGLSSAMRTWLCEKHSPLLLYVSCDPASLARDSRELIQSGYVLQDLHLYDFYPQTAHIESLAVFLRGDCATVNGAFD
jgi:23S rRNA (uracil1939-C5)-methyltransferase